MKMNYKKTKKSIEEKIIKTYKYNKLISIPLLIIAYYSAIIGYIRLIQNIENSMFPIVMDGIYAVIILSILTNFIVDKLKTNITINDSYIEITKSGKVTRKIDLSKVSNIDYFEMPILKFMNFLYIYEDNKEFESIDFEIKNHFELYKEIVEKVKNNPNIKINEKLLKRLKNK